MNDTLKEKLALLPGSPGVYLMKDAEGTIIYVGKAISLKNRVRQYFQASKTHSSKVLAMVSHVSDFDTVLVANETEALSLESNLIKEYKPKYNILLKDDKHFPYVRIDMRQDFPRVEIARRVKKDGATYLGPYLSTTYIKERLSVITEHYPLRTCKKDINKMIARRERPCLMYHIGKCCAPCSGNVTKEAYHAMLEEVCSFLDGHAEDVLRLLRAQMLAASEEMAFERAAALRDRIRAIESLNEKQAVIATNIGRLDVFALGRAEGQTLIFALFVRGGKVIGTERFRMDAGADETDGDVLAAFLTQYYADAVAFVPEVLAYQTVTGAEGIEEWLTQLAGRKVHVFTPQRGEKRRLTELAYRNCLDTLEKDATLQKRVWERGEGALAQLTGILGLETLPARMECFDNSHIMGQFTVSSMVVFTDGQPEKSAYRRFRIQGETGGDDIAAMREVLTRRFQKALDHDPGFLPLPDLLIIDGGRTQLDVALAVLSSLGLDYIPSIGLAETHETIYLAHEDTPIALPRNSAALHLIERLRDEAHRFAISYHRGLRQKNALFSVLDNIPGIGDKRKRALFDAFVSIDRIREASEEALAAVPGMNTATAKAVRAYFDKDAAPAGSTDNGQDSGSNG